MFPLQLRIEREDGPASFEMPNDGSMLSATPTQPRYHVTAVMLDTDRKRTLSYEFWSMIEPTKDDVENIGRITITPTSEQVEKLRDLRDALNEILGEA